MAMLFVFIYGSFYSIVYLLCNSQVLFVVMLGSADKYEEKNTNKLVKER
jgi:hypothetical protein